jgi:hypothetical protein
VGVAGSGEAPDGGKVDLLIGVLRGGSLPLVLEAELVCESSLWRSLWPGRILVKKLEMRCPDLCSRGGRCDSDLGGTPVLARCSKAGMLTLIEGSKDEVAGAWPRKAIKCVYLFTSG